MSNLDLTLFYGTDGIGGRRRRKKESIEGTRRRCVPKRGERDGMVRRRRLEDLHKPNGFANRQSR